MYTILNAMRGSCDCLLRRLFRGCHFNEMWSSPHERILPRAEVVSCVMDVPFRQVLLMAIYTVSPITPVMLRSAPIRCRPE